ncbi:uncharacterized protein LOC128746192 [Sabethes cyaneus]|uniref:uncharacterized protein LOC128746192 n=1 Tax=Sabethes cyaneus TaxID=53552 RepID=UPI00237E9ABE|nr:uncharacterized protein LOC128746192 [Sabethes cyaneus]
MDFIEETSPTCLVTVGKQENFWRLIEEEIGKVAPHVKNILNYQNLAANKAIGSVTDNDIDIIEQQLRNSAGRVSKWLSGGMTLDAVYGAYADQPEQFMFSLGEKRVISTIATTVRDQGIKKFLSERKNASLHDCSTSVPVINQESERDTLIQRIRHHISQSWDSSKISLDESRAGLLIALLPCPVCGKQLKATRLPPRSWMTYNLLRHVNNHQSSPPIDGISKNRSKKSRTISKRYKLDQYATDDEEISFIEQQKQFHANVTDDDSAININSSQTLRLVIEPDLEAGSTHAHQEDSNASEVEILQYANSLTNGGLRFNRAPVKAGCHTDHQRTSSATYPNGTSVIVGCIFNVRIHTHPERHITERQGKGTRTLIRMHSRIKDSNIHSRQYSELEKDICAFQYLTAGNGQYEYLRSNMATMSKKTIQRHITKYTVNLKEGEVDVSGLKKYLVENDYPLMVVLSEDGTRITAAAQYDYRNNSIRGLVAPMDANGLPTPNLFEATTPRKMQSDLNCYPMGNYAYVQLALPLARNAAPYVLYHACSNNKFEHSDVLNRWYYVEDLLSKEGITVVAHASDGDSRLLKAMKQRAGFNTRHFMSHWGSWFISDRNPNSPVSVQDTIHTINKLRNRLLNGDMLIGSHTISKQHLKSLLAKTSKDKHGLCLSDIDLKDKMKFGPTMKLLNPAVTQCLNENIEGSEGTAVFIDMMGKLYRSYIEKDVTLLERVYNIWVVNFFMRGWRNWCLQKRINSKLCITTNAYCCVELNSHALLEFITACRDRNVPEQCIIENLSSQPCEKIFRQLRSMASTNQTIVNFTVKELTEKLRRIQMKMTIMLKHQKSINFPALICESSTEQSMPSDDELITVVEKAMITARRILFNLGLDNDSIDLCNSLNKTDTMLPAIEFINIGADLCVSDDEMESEDIEHTESFLQDEPISDEGDHSHETTTTGDIFDAAELFDNCNDGLNLKSSRVGDRHSFKIRDSDGRIKVIKKSTVLWMFTQGRQQLSTDRIRRFQQKMVL